MAGSGFSFSYCVLPSGSLESGYVEINKIHSVLNFYESKTPKGHQPHFAVACADVRRVEDGEEGLEINYESKEGETTIMIVSQSKNAMEAFSKELKTFVGREKKVLNPAEAGTRQNKSNSGRQIAAMSSSSSPRAPISVGPTIESSTQYTTLPPAPSKNVGGVKMRVNSPTNTGAPDRRVPLRTNEPAGIPHVVTKKEMLAKQSAQQPPPVVLIKQIRGTVDLVGDSDEELPPPKPRSTIQKVNRVSEFLEKQVQLKEDENDRVLEKPKARDESSREHPEPIEKREKTEEKKEVSPLRETTAISAKKRSGMRNTGNSCYFNAVVQSLLSLRTFSFDLIEPAMLASIEQLTSGTEDSSSTGGAKGAGSCYVSFLSILREVAKKDHGVINPNPMQRAIGRAYQGFNNKQQQDAHELLFTCLELLEYESLQYLTNERYNRLEDDETPLHNRTYLLDPTKRNFSFVIQKSFTCSKCHDVAHKSEAFRDLQLDVITEDMFRALKQAQDNPETIEEMRNWIKKLEYPPTLTDLLEFYFMPELLERDCEKCHNKSCVLTKRFLTLPRVVVLQLKRFESEGRRVVKRAERVALQTRLDFGPMLADELQPPIPFPKERLKEIPTPSEKFAPDIRPVEEDDSIFSYSSHREASSKAKSEKEFDMATWEPLEDDDVAKEVKKVQQKEDDADDDFEPGQHSKGKRQDHDDDLLDFDHDKKKNKKKLQKTISKAQPLRGDSKREFERSVGGGIVSDEDALNISGEETLPQRVTREEPKRKREDTPPKQNVVLLDVLSDDEHEPSAKRQKTSDSSRSDKPKDIKKPTAILPKDEDDNDLVFESYHTGLAKVVLPSGWGVERPPEPDFAPLSFGNDRPRRAAAVKGDERNKLLAQGLDKDDADKLVNLSPSIGRTKSTVNLADDDEDMRKAVALSMNQPKNNGDDYDEELQQVLAMSKLEEETRQKEGIEEEKRLLARFEAQRALSGIKRPADPESESSRKKARLDDKKEAKSEKKVAFPAEMKLPSPRPAIHEPMEVDIASQNTLPFHDDDIMIKKSPSPSRESNFKLVLSQDSGPPLEVPVEEEGVEKEKEKEAQDRMQVDPDGTVPLDSDATFEALAKKPIDLCEGEEKKEKEEEKSKKNDELNRALTIGGLISEHVLLVDERARLPKDELIKKGSGQYHLLCFISHLGSSASSGHYVSYIWDEEEGRWRCFNDSSVDDVLEEDLFDKYTEEYSRLRLVFRKDSEFNRKERAVMNRVIDPTFGLPVEEEKNKVEERQTSPRVARGESFVPGFSLDHLEQELDDPDYAAKLVLNTKVEEEKKDEPIIDDKMETQPLDALIIPHYQPSSPNIDEDVDPFDKIAHKTVAKVNSEAKIKGKEREKEKVNGDKLKVVDIDDSEDHHEPVKPFPKKPDVKESPKTNEMKPQEKPISGKKELKVVEQIKSDAKKAEEKKVEEKKAKARKEEEKSAAALSQQRFNSLFDGAHTPASNFLLYQERQKMEERPSAKGKVDKVEEKKVVKAEAKKIEENPAKVQHQVRSEDDEEHTIDFNGEDDDASPHPKKTPEKPQDKERESGKGNGKVKEREKAVDEKVKKSPPPKPSTKPWEHVIEIDDHEEQELPKLLKGKEEEEKEKEKEKSKRGKK